MTTPCECPVAGWCERHQQRKTPHIHHLCQTRKDYRRLWDRQAGEEKKESASASVSVVSDPSYLESRGLGDTIAKITSAVGIKPCGGCKQRQAFLNKLFPYRRKRKK